MPRSGMPPSSSSRSSRFTKDVTEVVRGSLTGNVVSNLLLVLGASLVAEARGAGSLLELPVARADRIRDRPLPDPLDPGLGRRPGHSLLAVVSTAISIVLLIVYVGATWYSLRRHHLRHVASDEEISGWSLRSALGVLAGDRRPALVAEILVGSLEVFSEKAGVERVLRRRRDRRNGQRTPPERGGAVIVAFQGEDRARRQLRFSSAAQVAVFLIPAVALLSWLIEPLSLSFPRPVEIAALAASVGFATVVLFGGQSSRARGVLLLAGYGVVVIAFFLAGDRWARRSEQGAGDRSCSLLDVVVRDLEMRHRANHRQVNRRPGETDSRFAEPSQRLVTIELEQSEIDLDEVRLDSLQVDRDARGDGIPRRAARAGVVRQCATW